MIVVADTSPFNCLVVIGHESVLPLLYTRILIPPAKSPSWLEIVRSENPEVIRGLHLGESQAIALAAQMGASVLLIDDQAGRREAILRGLAVAGTLSVLDDAAEAGLIDFDDAVNRLLRTNFRIAKAVLDEIRRKRSH